MACQKNNCTGMEVGSRKLAEEGLGEYGGCQSGGGGRVRSAESMMGSDSGLSRGSGCPEKCEARAMRWQERAGCQSKKVALIRRKPKESACQACSPKPRHSRNGRKERR